MNDLLIKTCGTVKNTFSHIQIKRTKQIAVMITTLYRHMGKQQQQQHFPAKQDASLSII